MKTGELLGKPLRIYLYIGITLSDYKVTQYSLLFNMGNYMKINRKICKIHK